MAPEAVIPTQGPAFPSGPTTFRSENKNGQDEGTRNEQKPKGNCAQPQKGNS